jgi:hypothetical protein
VVGRRLRRSIGTGAVIVAALALGAGAIATLEAMPWLEVSIVAESRETTDPYQVGRGD